MVFGCAAFASAQELVSGQARATQNNEFAAPAARVVANDLPQVTAAQTALHAVPSPRVRYSDQEWAAIKQQATLAPASTRAALTNALQPRGGAGLTPGAFTNFLGSNEDLGCSFLTPSDMGVAANTNFVVQAVNACYAVYLKPHTLAAGFPKSLAALMLRPAGTFVFDPRALYDYGAQRWVVIASEVSGGNGFLDIAASAGTDPRGAYHVYHIQTGGNGNFPDYPALGQDHSQNPFNGTINICANIFVIGGGFVTDQCDFLPKAPIYAGAGFSFNAFNGFSFGGTIDTLQPVNVSEKGQQPRATLLINSHNGGFAHPANGLDVWAFTNTIVRTGSPGVRFTAIHVATPSSYNFPANADQPGSDNSIETLDNRITGMVQYNAGRLYPMIDVANGGTSANLGWVVRVFFGIDNLDTTNCVGFFANACAGLTAVTIEQEFCYDCGAGHAADAYFGDIGVTPEGNWTMYSTFSNRSISPGTFYASNRVTWPTPFHDGGIFLCQNQHFYNQGRWGDYMATALDVTAGQHPDIYGSGMFVQGNGDWGTCIGANQYKLNEP